MNMFEDIEVQQYLSALGERSPAYSIVVMFDCQCVIGSDQSNAHSTIAEPVSVELAEIAANQGPENLRSVVMYLNKTSYLSGETMTYLMEKMLQCSEIETVERYYSVLDDNFTMHPPCAPYMKTEYEKLLLHSYKRYFKEIPLWNFLVNSFNQLTNESDDIWIYGENKVKDYGFKRCLNLCVSILQVDFEVSKINNCKPLIMKCINYNPERKTRMSTITKLLDKLFNSGYDFRVSIIDLAHLINQMMK